MKAPLLVALLCLPLGGQQTQSTLYTRDASGNVEASAAITKGEKSSLRVRSINGREVPLESADERVISQDANSRVVERLVRRHDGNGSAGPPELIRIEERKNPDGSTTRIATTWRSDLNGNRQLAERETAVVRTRGAATETSVTVDRPTLNGSLDTVEKRSQVERAASGGKQMEASVYRRDAGGTLREVEREQVVTTTSGGQEKTDATKYSLDADNKLGVSERRVGTRGRRADGVEEEQVQVYSRFAAAHTSDANTNQPRLQEEITRERRPGAGGSVVETVSVRARLPGDPSRFGVVEQATSVSTTVKDPSGKETTTTETKVNRREANGSVAPAEQRRDVTVKSK